MPLTTFLNILGASVGFMSALFFAFGALAMTSEKINVIATTYWGANKHWGDSIAEQRADYIGGALLLLVSFTLQLSANLVSQNIAPSHLQPLGCASAEIVAVIAFLLVLTILVRNFVAKSTKEKIHLLIAAQEEASKKSLQSLQP